MATATSPTRAKPISSRSADETTPRQSQMRELLLGCGILSGALYFVSDAVMAAVYPGYSYLHQAISELNAFGAPTWGLSVAFGIAGYLLLVPFAAGIWTSAGVNSALRVSAGALAIMGITSLWALPFGSMQLRGTEQPVAHAITGFLGMLLLATAIGCAAAASGARFRLYSIATILIAVAFAGWAAMDSALIQAGLETPWVGLKERVSFYSWHVWFIVFAVWLMKRRSAARAAASATSSPMPALKGT